MMPIFPFIALFVGMLFHRISLLPDKRSHLALFTVLPLIIMGILYFSQPAFAAPLALVVDEANVGKVYKNQSGGSVPLYAIGDSNLETINYYSGTSAVSVDPVAEQGRIIKAPFYAGFSNSNVNVSFLFYADADGKIKSKFAGQQLLYAGPNIILIYSGQDFQIP